jgi:hypothetical protein
MNHSPSINIRRLGRPAVLGTLATSAAILLAAIPLLLADTGQNHRSPDVPEALQVPAGNKVAFHAFAVGVQIYEWSGTAWVFVAPEAVLFADAGGHGEVGIHYAGPSWESESGSKVVGARVAGSPVPDAIPWLLLKAVSTEGPGIFHRITYIQRVNTTGGTAPSGPGSGVGARIEVPYTAEYVFYREH